MSTIKIRFYELKGRSHMIRLVLASSFILASSLSGEVVHSEIKNTGQEYTFKTYSGCNQASFEKSLKAFYEKRMEKAAEGFGKIVNCGEEQWKKRSLFMLARTYLEMGRREEARDLFMRAVSDYEELADYSLYYLSESLLKEKDYERANETLRLLYKTYPESTLKGIAQFKEVESLYLSGKYNEAIKASDNFLKENPKAPMTSEAKLLKGKSMKGAGLIEEAAYTFKRLWIEEPVSASADKVIEEIKTVKFSARDFFLRAENLFKASQYSKAIADYQKAMELEEDTERVNEIRLRSGTALFRVKRYDEAIDTLKKVLTVDSRLQTSDSREALYYLAKAYLRKNNMDRFIKSSYEFYKLYPDDGRTPKILLMLADEFRRAGNKEKATEVYDIIINEYPVVSDDALYQRGWMRYLSGDFEGSSKDMRLLKEKYPGSPIVSQALYWEARSYERSGNKSMADAVYRSIIKEHASSYYGYMARKRLKEGESTVKISGASSYMMSAKRYNHPSFDIPFPKIRELKTLGMKDEAVIELDYLRERYMPGNMNTSQDLEKIINICKTYLDLQEYSKTISLSDGYSKMDKRFSYLSYPLGFWALLGESSDKTMIDPYLLASVIREESRFDHRAVSRAGAIGLMQVIPSTWKWIKGHSKKTPDSRLQTNSDPFDPHENISRGSWYLRYLLDKFNHNLIIALSAYNAGPEAVSSWLKKGPKELDEFVEEIPYRETRAYIKRVLRSYEEYRRIYNITD